MIGMILGHSNVNLTFGFFWIVLLAACANTSLDFPESDNPYVIVLGIAQDAGYPQAGCQKKCCAPVWSDLTKRKMVSCIAVVDPKSKKAWMIDATPDFRDQHRNLTAKGQDRMDLAGIFLTHAHIGHYTGLMHLGREVMGAQEVPVYCMPRMKKYLEGNGPWSQLVSLGNISIQPIYDDSTVMITPEIAVTPVEVPHRDEFSETVGYSIRTGDNSLLFIPDIDKWSKWNLDIKEMIRDHEHVLIDGSFYANGEIPGRDMSEIPHPFVQETMTLLRDMDAVERDKVHFIHLNHTNPLLDKGSVDYQEVSNQGFHVAEENQIFPL